MEDAITKTQGVCGGDACIAGTRIPVWLVDSYSYDGIEPTEMLEMWPHLNLEQIEAAIDYAVRHPEEIHTAQEQNESALEE